MDCICEGHEHDDDSWCDIRKTIEAIREHTPDIKPREFRVHCDWEQKALKSIAPPAPDRLLFHGVIGDYFGIPVIINSDMPYWSLGLYEGDVLLSLVHIPTKIL